MSRSSVVSLAKALGYFLAVVIIVSMLSGLSFVVSLFSDKNVATEIHSIYSDEAIVSSLDISLKTTSLEIISADKFNLETNNSKIKADYQNGKLKVKENGSSVFNKGDLVLRVYVPSDYDFENVSLETGAGKVDVDALKSKKAVIKLGAGKIY